MLSLREIPQGSFDGMKETEIAQLGIPTRDEIVDRYAKASGRPLAGGLDFYMAYNLFRSAAIYQGILGRVRDGTAASANIAGDGTVRPIAQRAMAFAERLGA
jgi:aminoglycoside phosphotransferase (APT) family kinase protein